MSESMFIPGLELARQLAADFEPRLRHEFPGVAFSLAFLGSGSDVLGYDTSRSMDHDWGPRITILVPEDSRLDFSSRVDNSLDRLLPESIAGFSTRFSYHSDGTMKADPGGSAHRLDVTSLQEILQTALLINSLDDLTDAVWLSTPMQTLLELTSGEVFVDDSGELTELQRVLAFYPDHIWRYQLAGLWQRVAQIQPFIGRTAEVGDKAGSAMITASVARDFMRIALLQSRRYAPYAKWLGSAFFRTTIGREIHGSLDSALTARNWQQREDAVNNAGLSLVAHLNSLALIPNLPAAITQFHSRPFHILPAEDIAHALSASLRDTPMASLPPYVGGIDIVTDSTDALNSLPIQMAFRRMIRSILR